MRAWARAARSAVEAMAAGQHHAVCGGPSPGLPRPFCSSTKTYRVSQPVSSACLPERLSSGDSSSQQADGDATLVSPHVTSAAAPVVLATGIAGFAVTAWDVFSPNSYHVLPGIDKACHEFAVQLSPTFRLFWADIVLSDTFIALGILGWVACTVVALLQRKPSALVAVVIAWAFYVWGAGPIQYDPWLVDVLKHAFMRIRPSPVHHSFSFPSGHTSSGAFTMGALLFVLLPAVLPQAAGNPAAVAGHSKLVSFLSSRVQGSWAMWGVACCVTGAGRVLADAHWMSDTVAASCLGLCTVSLLALAVRLVTPRASKWRPPSSSPRP